MTQSGEDSTLPLLSRRGAQSISGQHSKYLDEAFMKWYANPFHPKDNPEGFLNLGTAENRLMSDVLTEKLSAITRYDPETQYYFDKRGFATFRSKLASLLSARLGATPPLDPHRLIVVNGAAAALDGITHAIADAGDAFLGVSPCYRGIENMIGLRSLVEMIPVPTRSDNGYRLTIDVVAAALASAKEDGRRVRGIVLMNPHNPLGTVMTKEAILEILRFAKTHHLHVVFDEVFALSVFEPGTKFCSVASLASELPDPSRTHFYWSFSKDFCLSGFRCGFAYSWSSEVVDALTILTTFQVLSAPIQFTLEALLSDEEWLDRIYFPENLKRLKAAKDDMTMGLRRLGVRVLDNVAGFCVWVNFSDVFPSSSADRTTEDSADCIDRSSFLRLLNDERIYIVPGYELLSSERGWARVLFACSAPERSEFLRRLRSFIDVTKDPIVRS